MSGSRAKDAGWVLRRAEIWDRKQIDATLMFVSGIVLCHTSQQKGGPTRLQYDPPPYFVSFFPETDVQTGTNSYSTVQYKSKEDQLSLDAPASARLLPVFWKTKNKQLNCDLVGATLRYVPTGPWGGVEHLLVPESDPGNSNFSEQCPATGESAATVRSSQHNSRA